MGVSKASVQEVVFAAVAASGHRAEPHKATLYQIHLRLGHLSYDTIERISRQANFGIELTDHDRPHCVMCSQGKGTRSDQPQKDSGENAPIDRIGGVIVSDLKGPIAPRNKRGHKYMVTFIEYLSNYVRVFTARYKHKAAAMFLHSVAWFENEFNCRIRVLRTDGGGEYDTQTVDLFCKPSGIRRQKTEAGTPQSNGKAERMNRTLFNMVWCMLFGSGIPLTHWSDAAEYAAFILNRTPTRANKSRASPLEILTGKAPSLQGIVVFGSPCQVWRDPKKKSLKARTVDGFILGKNEETKGYKVLICSDRSVITTRHVSHIETLDAATNKLVIDALQRADDDELEALADARADAAQRKQDAPRPEETQEKEPATTTK